MDKNQCDPTEQVLNLTLEIILLLTGEDYFVVKKSEGRATNNSLELVEGSWYVHIPLPQLVMHEPQNKQKILELTKKITELLTGEVPIRCQDVSVHFSLEEWKYLEGHKEIYKDIMENHKNLTSAGLPKSGINEYPPMRIKEERYRGNLTYHDIYTHTDHIQQHPSTSINEELVSCDGRNLIETTQPYSLTHIKEEPISCNGGTLTNQNIYAPTDLHTQQYVYTYLKEERSSCDGGVFKDHTNTSFDQTPLPTHMKDELDFRDGESLTDSNTYAVKDHNQQCSSHVNEDTVSCSGGNLIWNAHYPATPATEDTNLPDTNSPETQWKASDHINIRYSCSECQKCFLSMAELVAHQGIHIAEKLLQVGNQVFTTAIVQGPQIPPVKHKLLTCSKCGRTFYTKSSLVGHMKTHWGEINHIQNETFKCDQCGKCFSSKSLLRMHSRLHLGVRPYACSTCGDRFMRTGDLSRHKKKH